MIEVDILFAAVPVDNFDSGVAWYTRLFGRPADVVVTDDEVMWRFGDSAWLYVLRDPERAGHTVVTLCVSDLDQTVADIEGRGITCGPLETVGEAGRRAVVTDADGNAVSFIEVPG